MLLVIIGLTAISIQRSSAPAAVSEGVPVSSAPTPGPAAAAEVAVFIGDSYTSGTGASSTDLRWTTLASQSMGWKEDNRGLGGTGYLKTAGKAGCGRSFCANYESVSAGADGMAADVIVVAGGQNDFGLWGKDPAAVTRAIDDTFRDLRQAHPTARIVAVGPSSGDRIDDQVIAMDLAVREAATDVSADYVSLIEPKVISAAMVASDRAHVNDAGHRAIAERVTSQLK